MTADPHCHAPFSSMELDPAGYVNACCVNSVNPIGRYPHQTLHEIWTGARAERLRAAILRGDDGYGCATCRHRERFEDGIPERTFYDYLPAEAGRPYPATIAFSLGNHCNAACVMCAGDLSSKIRSQREHRPALESPYDEAFFAELDAFLPHLATADFRGGEPFLVPAHHRVWDRLRELNPGVPCTITTNGTQWTPKVEAVLDDFPCGLVVSVDGVTAETLESIRVGIELDELLTNLERFAAYVRDRGRFLVISACLLPQNLHEMADVFLLAERHGARMSTQTVRDRSFGVQGVDDRELDRLIDVLRRRDEEMAAALSAENLRVWTAIGAQLENERRWRARGETFRIWDFPTPDTTAHIERVRDQARHPVEAPLSSAASPHLTADRRPRRRRRVGAELRAWSTSERVGSFRTDRSGAVVEADLAPLGLSAPPADHSGSTSDLLDWAAGQLGRTIWIADEFAASGRVDQTLHLGRSRWRDRPGIVVRLVSLPDRRGGIRTVLAVDDAHDDEPPADLGVPVALGARTRATR